MPYCPLCWAVADLRQPFCGACGMSLEGARHKALVDGYFGSWGDPGGTGRRWRRPGRLSAMARASLVVVAALSIAVVVAAVVQLSGTPISMSSVRLDARGYTTWGGRLAVASVSALVVAGLLLVLWTRRSYRNLAALGVSGLRLRTGWATASWFIPFVNLVLPKEVVDDLWRASDPESPPLTSTWRLRTVPFWINVWWIAVLGSGVLLCAAQWLPVDAAAASYDEVQLSVLIVAHLVLAFGAVLTMILIGDVNRRQQQRIEILFQPPVGLEVLETDGLDGFGRDGAHDDRRARAGPSVPTAVAVGSGEPPVVVSVVGRY